MARASLLGVHMGKGSLATCSHWKEPWTEDRLLHDSSVSLIQLSHITNIGQQKYLREKKRRDKTPTCHCQLCQLPELLGWDHPIPN